MFTPRKPRAKPRARGRTRLILTLLAALSSIFAWQHIQGLGLGDRPIARVAKDEDSMID
ncbi:MAG: hypothetical protein AAGD14_12925 [Planctomycetota bacterium]